MSRTKCDWFTLSRILFGWGGGWGGGDGGAKGRGPRVVGGGVDSEEERVEEGL